MEEIKPIYSLHHYDLKTFPKYRDELAPHQHRMLLLKWLWHFTLAKAAPVDVPSYRTLVPREFRAVHSEVLDLGALSYPLRMWSCWTGSSVRKRVGGRPMGT